MAVLADEGYTAISWTAGAAFAHQITEDLREERGGKHTWGRHSQHEGQVQFYDSVGGVQRWSKI